MPIDPSIALQVRPPVVPDQLEMLAKQAQLRNAGTQGAIGVQQLQSGQIALQQQQQDQQDQQTIRKLYMDNGGDFDKVVAGAAAAGVSPKTMISLQQQRIDLKTKLADLTEKEQKNTLGIHDQLRGQIQSYLGQPDEAKAAGWVPFIQQQAKAGNLKPEDAQQLLQAHPQYPGDDTLKLYSNGLATGSQLIKELQAEREVKAKETTANADAAYKKAQTDQKNFELSLEKGASNGSGEATIRARFATNPIAQQHALDAWRQTLPAGIKAATEEVNRIYDNEIGSAAKITSGTAPTVAREQALMPVKVATAKSIASATEPIRAQSNADAQVYLMKQVGGPLQNVMDPAERARVSNDYLKANDAYAEKSADAQRLKQFVAAARTGNQSAAGLMTISELRSVVNRVNTKELEQAGGASIIRSITNKLDKSGTGIPSEDTLKELEQVADLNEKTAATGFAQKVRGIKTLSPKANLSETPIGAATAPSAGGWKVKR